MTVHLLSVGRVTFPFTLSHARNMSSAIARPAEAPAGDPSANPSQVVDLHDATCRFPVPKAGKENSQNNVVHVHI